VSKETDKTHALLEDAARRGIAYRELCAARSVAPTPKALGNISRFIEPLPENGTPDEEVLALLDEAGSPATVAMAGPRFFGFVVGGSMPVSVATNWLTTAWDQNVAMHEVTPGTGYLPTLGGTSRRMASSALRC
jgi:glutamate/tyrosine decarboxylase-like PLP-dependent enzyme